MAGSADAAGAGSAAGKRFLREQTTVDPNLFMDAVGTASSKKVFAADLRSFEGHCKRLKEHVEAFEFVSTNRLPFGSKKKLTVVSACIGTAQGLVAFGAIEAALPGIEFEHLWHCEKDKKKKVDQRPLAKTTNRLPTRLWR